MERPKPPSRPAPGWISRKRLIIGVPLGLLLAVLVLGVTWRSGPDSHDLSKAQHLPAWLAAFVAVGVILFVSPRVDWFVSWIAWGLSWPVWLGARVIKVAGVVFAIVLLVIVTVFYFAAILSIVGLIAELVAHFAFSVKWHRLGTGPLYAFNVVAIPLAVIYLFFHFAAQESTIAMIDGMRRDSGLIPMTVSEQEEIRKAERQSRTSLLDAWRTILRRS
jgi:hypothetical protein